MKSTEENTDRHDAWAHHINILYTIQNTRVYLRVKRSGINININIPNTVYVVEHKTLNLLWRKEE